MEPKLTTLALVIADISSYTEFIKFNKTSLLHASQIVSELLESVIEKAAFPLILNKIEGDATFLYSDIGSDPKRGLQDVAQQVQGFFDAFRSKVADLGTNRNFCGCDACQNVKKLRLKAILHAGEAAIRQIHKFEELTGENVILVHRLLKNSVPSREYILATEAFHQMAGGLPFGNGEARDEKYDDLGTVKVQVFYPN